jgi:hypothetical protein
MLTLRRAQVDTLAVKLRAPFLDDVEAYVRRHYPESAWNQSSSEVQKRLDESIDRAANYGISEAEDVVMFIDCTYQLDRDFDTRAGFEWAQEILTDPACSGHESVTRVFNKIHGLRGEESPGREADGEAQEAESDTES